MPVNDLLILIVMLLAVFVLYGGVAYKNLRERNKKLKEQLESKNEFLRIANHQLHTPLYIMNSAYSMMKDRSLGPEEGLQYLAGGLSRMTEAVEGIWGVFQSEGEVVYSMQPVNIVPVLQDAVEAKKRMLALTKKGTIISLKHPGDLPLALCDIGKIKQVIYNLLDNAVFYTPRGSIAVTCERQNSFLKVIFTDTGIGFNPQDKEKLGQKFYRSRQAAKVHPGGSGLGLYICKNIIERHGGKLDFESLGEGKGSVFSFTVPIAG